MRVPQKCREILSAFRPECPYKAVFFFCSHSVCFSTATHLQDRSEATRPFDARFMGFLWDVTVVDSLAPCRINAGSVCNPGTAVTEAEERKNDKYKDLVVDGYLFQPLAFEIQGAAGPSTEIFLSKLCKNLSICTKEPRAGSFLKQRISLAVQIANAACVLGTINDKITFDEFFLFLTLVYYIFSCRVACSY